ncbi:MAG: GNAT family N-acetyltransferase [Inhella sp.]|uniref:GNAT family N-acetyltransferase n=1 Tax=Inhella sp. TaxID=1921806 RepID=UPI003918DB67
MTWTLRAATLADALPLSVLATQVWLDTYCTEGVDDSLAREVRHSCGPEAFEARLREPQRHHLLAERAGGRLQAFVELLPEQAPPLAGLSQGVEVVRLYVQPSAQGQGLGARMLGAAADWAQAQHQAGLWLTVWSGNARARRFYARQGWVDRGPTLLGFEGRSYTNHVLERVLARG